MVAQPHDPAIRHNELLKAAQDIADKNQEIERLTYSLNAHKARADRAESVVRQLEAQLATEKREIKSLYSYVALPVDQEKLDADLAKMTSAGWERFDSGVIPGDKPIRFISLIRVAPLQPATDQPPITASETIQESLTVQPAPETPLSVHGDRREGLGEGLIDPVAYPPPHPSIAGLWDALYALDRFAELVQHWPQLLEFAPRVYAIFADAGCDMTDTVIMKSFRLGHRADERTLKASFRKPEQIVPGTRTALVVAGFGNVVQRDGREFIFDLPPAWLSPSPRKTITASSMTIMTDGNTEPAPAADDFDGELNQALRETYEKAVAANPMPRYTSIPTYSPNGGL